MSQYKIAPSILAADYANFEREIKRLEATGAEYAHIDIMDGHFVPQISFGAGVVEALRPHSKMVFDCHLMVANPEHHLEDFARAGADIISIHVEATPHIHGALQKIRSLGVKPSVVINPAIHFDFKVQAFFLTKCNQLTNLIHGFWQKSLTTKSRINCHD